MLLFVTSQMHFIVNIISLINEVCDITDAFYCQRNITDK